MYERIKRRTYEILEGTRHTDRTSLVVQWFIITLIVLNVAAVVLATVQELQEAYAHFFWLFEVFSVAIFTVEYLLRVWVCTENPRFQHPVKGRLRFLVTPAAVIDLLAILPFFLPRLPEVDLRAIRALRIFRLLRLLKLGHYSESTTLLVNALRNKKEQLLLAVLAVIVVLIFASSFLYFAERQAQPDKFGNIPQAMWWGVITLTTVGYGNVYPVTTLGKVLGGCICLLGIGLFALPAGILASGFEEALEKREELRGERRNGGDEEEQASTDSQEVPEEQQKYCPCCGHRLAEA